MSLQTVQRFLRQKVSVSSQQPGQTQEGLYQEESGECFPVFLVIYLPLCLTILPSGFHQVMLARQAVRFRRRVTRKTTKQRLLDSRKLLRTLRLLAKEVRSHRVVTIQSTKTSTIIKCLVQSMCDPAPPTIISPAPDYHPRCVSMAAEWKKAIGLCQDPCKLCPLLIGGGAEGARLWQSHHPLHEGNHLKAKMTLSVSERVQWYLFCLTLPSLQSPGSALSEIFAKLEVYIWLGLAKYSKEATNNLPEEFLPIYEEEDEENSKPIPPGLRKLPVSLSCQGE